LFFISHFLKSAIRNLQSKIWWNLILALLFLFFMQSPALAQSPSQLDDTSLFHEGEIFLSKGDTERALWRFKRLITDFPKSPLLNEAKFRMGICYTQLKRPQDAIRILNELLSTFLSPSRMIQVFSLLGDNYLELKDRLTALHWYGKGILVPGQPPWQSHDELKKKVRSILDTYDSGEELNQIESLYRGAYAGGYAKLKLAQLAKRQGNNTLARKILVELEKEYRGVEYGPLVKDLSESISPPPKSKYTVGVILPLSGIHQPFGERVLHGIQLAIPSPPPSPQQGEGKGEGDKIPLISLAIRDSKGSPWEAEKAVEELVTTEKVIAILGPLLSNTAERAAKKAQQMKVPLLTLSQKELKGDFIFQNSITPSDQVQTLVEFAIRDLDLRTYAVFYPNSPYGVHFKNLFVQEVSRRGGKVLGVVVYQEDQTDFSQEIKGFFKIETIQKSDSRKKKDEEYKTGFSVDGLFIPDAHDRVGAILSQIAYYDVKGLTFLGNGAWNGPGLISIGGVGAEGATFVDTFFKGDSSPMVSHFVQEFRKTYQRDPQILEAFGYDGAKFLKDILQSKWVPSPLQLKEEIHQVQDFQGVSGLKGFGEDGKAIRTLTILRVHKGQIEKISP
jgi:ABC-type branched-subunit amino acid transport system substrate-binding protein